MMAGLSAIPFIRLVSGGLADFTGAPYSLLYAPANPEPDCLNEPKEPNGPNDIKEPYRLDQLLP